MDVKILHLQMFFVHFKVLGPISGFCILDVKVWKKGVPDLRDPEVTNRVGVGGVGRRMCA